MTVNSALQLYGPFHAVALVGVAIACGAILAFHDVLGSRRVVRIVSWALAAILLANEMVYYATGLRSLGVRGFLAHYLPLHICGVAVYMAVITLLTRNAFCFEIAYFWGLVGGIAALLLPDAPGGFSTYGFWQFVIGHGAVMVAVVFATVAIGMRPRRGSVSRVFAVTLGWLVVVAAANPLVGGNYMYLQAPPEVPAPLGPLRWPWYIPAALGCLYVAFGGLARLSRSRSRNPS